MPYDESIISFHKESMLGNFAHLQKKMSQAKMSGGIMYKKTEFLYIFFMYSKITFTGTMWRTTCRMV